jgi:HlyD family secretion protein
MIALPGWLAATLAAVVPGLGTPDLAGYNGYIEADYVYAAPDGSGRIAAIDVTEGDVVTAGQIVLRLDDTSQKAALNAAMARVEEARANLENLKTGSRDAEIAVVRASLRQAEANQTLARSTLARSQELRARDLIPSAQLDADEAALATADAHVAQLRAELDVAGLPARDAQLVAAQAALEAASAEAEAAQSDLDDRVVRAPAGGRVEDVFYDAGEVAGAGAPALSILPEDLKVLFFVPEAERAGIAIGDRLAVECDGCRDGMVAELYRLASDPQYAPPIIYSRTERSRLVFRAEARLIDPGGLLPGQPVSVRPIP